MRFSLNISFSGITVLLLCILEIPLVSGLQNDTSFKSATNVGQFDYDLKNVTNTTVRNTNNLLVYKTLDVNDNGVLNSVNVTVHGKAAVTRRIKKRRKSRRKAIQHKALALTTESSSQSSSNQTEPNTNIKKKRRRKLRRRKNRKNRRKQNNTPH
ncbi:uncharacterized protein LOC111691711 [Anoplophora glabripennis]|uniref:uncharacterized protein LOC111691711 n=1 Tax=Anoplophora glabripennis TaxID=217634 RepID=UPI000C788065|nr:uncharacterized protein LOC111691711 [Anoplophora glabripennis]